ncbi:MAG TPA: tyrosine-type recombinase/integrase [Actinomycetota bacterium]|nr:tyrosine-type recombinase/integrase [Actinomycetota bacterium]
MGAEGFRRWLRQAALHARIGRRVYPHLLRHSFATALARKADPRTWQAAMGHADLSQYARYADPDEAAVQEAVERIAPALLTANGNGHRRRARLPPEPEPAQPVTLTQAELRRALGERDWELLRLLAEDLTNAEIAQELDLAASTVKEHLTPL